MKFTTDALKEPVSVEDRNSISEDMMHTWRTQSSKESNSPAVPQKDGMALHSSF